MDRRYAVEAFSGYTMVERRSGLTKAQADQWEAHFIALGYRVFVSTSN
jgi:hypothetical protein